MKNFLKKKIQNFIGLTDIRNKNELILKNLGLLHNKLNKDKKFDNIQDYEFQIFSQFGDDGIIRYLINNIKNIENKFIEFGVENYEEANTKFLLESFNWEGLIIDSNNNYVSDIKKKNYYWRYNLNVANEFISKENINSIINDNNFSGEIGILSIDIDGNDYWIWEEINAVNPSIVIIEYNALFGDELSVTIPYNKNFSRNNNQKDNVYYGASLNALFKLGNKKNYSLICTNSNGNNAYFLRNDLIPVDHYLIKQRTPQECFNRNSFKEVKDLKNNFIKLSKEEEFEIINKFDLIKI
jgi:hypothetical protein